MSEGIDVGAEGPTADFGQRGDAGVNRAIDKQRGPTAAAPNTPVHALQIPRVELRGLRPSNATHGPFGGAIGAFLAYTASKAPTPGAFSLGALFLDPLEASV